MRGLVVETELSDDALFKYRGILDLENSNQQTPFFVAVIKGFLDIAELLVADRMSSVEAKDTVI